MYKNKKILAIIPARGGSKRILHKNLVDIHGKPLIYWSITAAKESKYIDTFIVSTDDEAIETAANQFGAETPFRRDASLATDTAKLDDLAVEILQQFAEQNNDFDYVMLLQPTSPLRTAQHIDEAIEQLIDKKGDSVIAVTPLSHPFEWSHTLDDDLSLTNFLKNDDLKKRSQDFPKRYIINGAIYIVRCDRLLESHSFFQQQKSFAYIMSRGDAIDIDSDDDIDEANYFFSLREQRKH